MKKQTITEIFKRFQRANPAPKTELVYHSAFELLIAVVLSAQATDISVNKATTALFPIANTPTQILALGEAGLKQYIRHIGLYNSKARHIIALCDQLLKRHHGQVPKTRQQLEALAGVGRKSANVILNTVFAESTVAVDTHIFRVSNRMGLALGKTPFAVEKKLLTVIPKKFLRDAHHWLVLHGRYTCVARKPKCSECIINDLCVYRLTFNQAGLLN